MICFSVVKVSTRLLRFCFVRLLAIRLHVQHFCLGMLLFSFPPLPCGPSRISSSAPAILFLAILSLGDIKSHNFQYRFFSKGTQFYISSPEFSPPIQPCVQLAVGQFSLDDLTLPETQYGQTPCLSTKHSSPCTASYFC